MSKDFELKVINKPLYYIEMIALLHRLVNNRNFNRIKVNTEQNAFLDLLQGFRIKGLELFELFLYKENIDDIGMLESFLIEINQTDFLYLLFGEEISKADIEAIRERFEAINEMPQIKKLLTSYDSESLRSVFQRTREFIDSLKEIFEALNAYVVEQLAKEELYKEGITKVSSALKTKIPLEVAQGIMGKKFVRVFDFSTYYFVPSYFYMNRPMRTFSKRTQVVVYPIQEVNEYNKSALANALRVIADNTRLEIIEKLAARPMYGKELAKELGLVTSTVSHHLEQLRSIGLLNEEREKSVKYFSINTNEYNKLCDELKSFIALDKTR